MSAINFSIGIFFPFFYMFEYFAFLALKFINKDLLNSFGYVFKS